jgi:hypothetical protein
MRNEDLRKELAFLTRPKSAILGVLSALVKDSRQFKQREKRLLKVVTVNLLLYKFIAPRYKQLQYYKVVNSQTWERRYQWAVPPTIGCEKVKMAELREKYKKVRWYTSREWRYTSREWR